MNENINLCEILKGHEGETFYSPTFGNIKLNCITDIIYFESINGKVSFDIYPNGTYCTSGELIIFPSKDQRDWNKWVEEQKHKVPKTWSELIKSKTTLEYKISVCNKHEQHVFVSTSPIEKAALALLKIHQLIEVGYGGNINKEEWECPINAIYWISTDGDSFTIETTYDYPFCRIAFHTKSQAKEFLSYPENVQLLKDYFMI